MQMEQGVRAGVRDNQLLRACKQQLQNKLVVVVMMILRVVVLSVQVGDRWATIAGFGNVQMVAAQLRLQNGKGITQGHFRIFELPLVS